MVDGGQDVGEIRRVSAGFFCRKRCRDGVRAGDVVPHRQQSQQPVERRREVGCAARLRRNHPSAPFASFRCSAILPRQ